MPATNSSTVPPNGGELFIAISSLEDLPCREHPSHVVLQACGQKRQLGPPLPHSKNQNCFEYCSSSSSDNAMKIQTKPLKYLYDTSFLLRVVYQENPTHDLIATLAMKDLGINHANQLELELKPENTATKMEDNAPTPTIQLHAELRGAFRREIQYAIRLANAWFRIMDAVERTVYKRIPSNRATQQLMQLPAVPAILATLLLTPFLAATLLLTLPFAFPLLALFLSSGIGFLLAFFILYASTSRGRNHVYPTYVKPTMDRILTTPVGQSLLYPIGPRPTPVDALELLIPQNKYARLILSVAIDFIGCSSYLLPFVGEMSDLVWAPLQTILIMAMYNHTSPKLKYLSFLEEILPFTDAIPSATIGWFTQYCGGSTRNKVEIPNDLELKEN